MALSNWPEPNLRSSPDSHGRRRLTEPHTKTVWREYIRYQNPSRPAPLTDSEYQALPVEAQAQYDSARAQFHSSLALVNTPAIEAMELELSDLLHGNSNSQPGAGNGLIVSGPPRVGKSTTIKMILRDYEIRLRKQRPDLFERQGDEFIPVAFAQTPPTGPQASSALLRAIVRFYEAPLPTTVSVPDLQVLAIKLMERCETQVVVLDDLHFLNMTERSGRAANDLLKALANNVSPSFVAIGVNLENSHLFSEGPGRDQATQTSGRYSTAKMEHFEIGTESLDNVWRSVILALEQVLVLHKHDVGTLT